MIVLSGGTPHKPNPLDARGFWVSEAASNARYLLALGVSPERVLEESFSLDTLGNAYFARAVHTDVRALCRLAVVNNGFHMPRTR